MKNKRTIFVLFVIIVITVLISPSANAANSNWEYNYIIDSNGNATITGYPDYDLLFSYTNGYTDRIYLHIPSELGGHTVTAIGDEAFVNCHSIMTVSIPDTVVSIGNHPFNSRVTDVYVSNGNPGLAVIDGVLYSKADKRLVYCPNKEMDKLEIPNGIQIIGEAAFFEREEINNIILPDTVISIQPFAFYRCHASEIKLSASCKEIGKRAFCGTFVKELVIPEGISKLPEEFISGSKISSIKLPSTLVEIGDSAFYDCRSMISITLPSKLETIGNEAFKDCTGLTSIKAPSTLKRIGNDAFLNTGIKDFVVSSSIEHIGDGALKNVETITLEEGNKNFEIDNNILYCLTNNYAVGLANAKVDEITIREGTIGIQNDAFYGKNIKNAQLPSSLHVIGDYAFSGCEFYDLILPSGLIEIGKGAFSGCKNLNEIIIPDTVQKIRDYAFSSCGSLKKVVFSANEIELGDNIFNNSENIRYTVPAGTKTEAYLKKNGYYYMNDDWLNTLEPTSKSAAPDKLSSCLKSIGSYTVGEEIGWIQFYKSNSPILSVILDSGYLPDSVEMYWDEDGAYLSGVPKTKGYFTADYLVITKDGVINCSVSFTVESK